MKKILFAVFSSIVFYSVARFYFNTCAAGWVLGTINLWIYYELRPILKNNKLKELT